jgi:hypothetical protein
MILGYETQDFCGLSIYLKDRETFNFEKIEFARALQGNFTRKDVTFNDCEMVSDHWPHINILLIVDNIDTKSPYSAWDAAKKTALDFGMNAESLRNVGKQYQYWDCYNNYRKK